MFTNNLKPDFIIPIFATRYIRTLIFETMNSCTVKFKNQRLKPYRVGKINRLEKLLEKLFPRHCNFNSTNGQFNLVFLHVFC